MQVLYLGRAPRTKETLLDFLKVASGNPTSVTPQKYPKIL